MNQTIVEGVRDYIQNHPQDLNMYDWGHETSCGTNQCIAGTAVIVANCAVWDNEGRLCDINGRFIPEAARREMGLSLSQTNSLFYTTNNVTPETAVRALDYLLKHPYASGEVLALLAEGSITPDMADEKI